MALGDLVIGLRADNRGFIGPLQMAQKTMGGFVANATKGFGQLGLAAMGVQQTLGLLERFSLPVQLAAQAEQTSIGFEVMTGSAEVAAGLLNDLRTMGAKTPFEFNDLSKASGTLLQFGRTAGTVMSDLDMLSNVAAGDAQKLQSLALVFGQISANGKLTGGDLLQLVNTGFNPLNQIAERTGESMTDLRDRMSKGKIPFEEVRQAFADATSEGGLFFEMNERQSQTLLGKWSTMKDEVTMALTEIGEAIVKEFDLKNATGGLTDFITMFKRDFVPPIIEGMKMIGGVISDVTEFANAMDELALRSADALGLTKDSADEILLAQKQAKERKAMADERNTGLQKEMDDKLNSIFDPARAQTQELLKSANALTSKDDEKWKDNGGLIDVSALMKENPPAPEAVKQFQAQMESQSAGVFEQSLDKLINARSRENEDNKIGSLEKDSQEAFEVLRQNVGQKPEEKQLKETQKQTKVLEKIEKKIARPDGPAIAVKGID